jgi:hypothetical protein
MDLMVNKLQIMDFTGVFPGVGSLQKVAAFAMRLFKGKHTITNLQILLPS